MDAEYLITEADYVKAMKLSSKITPKMALFYLLVIGVIALVAIFGPSAIRAGAIGGLISGGCTMAAFRLLINPMLARRHYRKYKALHDPIKINLLNEGVALSTPDIASTIRWEKIHKWRQNDDYLLIYPMPRLYHMIPKSVSERGFDLNALIQALHEKVGHES